MFKFLLKQIRKYGGFFLKLIDIVVESELLKIIVKFFPLLFIGMLIWVYYMVYPDGDIRSDIINSIKHMHPNNFQYIVLGFKDLLIILSLLGIGLLIIFIISFLAELFSIDRGDELNYKAWKNIFLKFINWLKTLSIIQKVLVIISFGMILPTKFIISLFTNNPSFYGSGWMQPGFFNDGINIDFKYWSMWLLILVAFWLFRQKVKIIRNRRIKNENNEGRKPTSKKSII